MSKITLTDLVNLENQTTAVTAINANNGILETAFDNTLSRDGTSPNTMSANFDMNSNRILNLPDSATDTEPVTQRQLNAVTTAVGNVPAGGTTNQLLSKNSATNYDMSWKAVTGTGSAVLATSPTLVTPTIGVATATSINGVQFVTSSGALSIANTKTFTNNNNLTLNATDGSTLNIGVGGTLTGSSASAIFYDNLPQNSKSAAYTTVLADAQKHIFHPSADTTARTWTIDSNANVAYPIGTNLTFINQNSGGVITIAITSDTMRLAGAGTTGNRSLAANGIATAVKVTATEWIISGTGLT
jgi:hypothetical protein